MAGPILLGLAAAAGRSDLATAFQAVGLALSVGVAPVVITGPALLVFHSFLGFRSSPETLARSILTGLAAGGRLGMGLAPTVLFLALTCRPTSTWLMLACGWALLRTFAAATRELRKAEGAVLPDETDLTPGITFLAWGWALLCSLIALRLAFLLIP